MRQLLLFASAMMLFASCKDEATETTTMVQSEKIEYAYTLDHEPDYWDKGNQQNVALALSSLKAFETGNVEESLKYFADSVIWRMDHFDNKLSKDSLRAMLKGFRDNLSSLTITMEDWETVISKDKKYEWVALWYKEKWTDKNGKSDSVFVMDDVRFENGKITELDEKRRLFAAEKK
jgi:hypothetical protein